MSKDTRLAGEANELALLADPGHTATIVVDMQNDFCDPAGCLGKTGKALGATRAIIPTIQTVVAASRRAGVPVIYIRSIYNAPGNPYLSDAWLAQARHRGDGRYIEIPVCAQGSWGSEIIPELQPLPEEPVVIKHRFSAFINTSLTAILRARRIQTLVFTGCHTHTCVESAVRDACHLDFNNLILSDGVGSWNPDWHRHSLTVMNWGFGRVITSADLLQAWQK